MQVLVITNDALREELLAGAPADGSVHFNFIQHPGDYQGNAAPDACIDLLFDNTGERINWLNGLGSPLIVINAVVATLGDTDTGFIRINGWPGFLKRPLVEAAAVDESSRNKAEELFVLLGRKTEWVPDISGFLTARVVASIINEAFFALEENISTEQEIDTAMKLGTNYPFGPFEWSEKIGLAAVYSLLAGLGREESRYAPCKLLEKKALI
ncbi:MAG TPA: 3-hydroxyacyl-CoA dehydrogenase family protein [Chitinophagaceae bacterium]|nr:3-hydroxyacyl-CoA dehydrogenase family protein [Chitinophagaceae bacterium]